MKKPINEEFKRMQELAGINEMKLNTLTELKSYIDYLVNVYVDDASDIAGENLDWDGDGSNMGISKEELINDFIGFLTDEIPYIK